jgi:hypothetical protein
MKSKVFSADFKEEESFSMKKTVEFFIISLQNIKLFLF